MCESYSRSLLRVSVAQICQALGWDSVQLSACHLLTDVLQRYLQQLGRGCHRYSELCEYRAGCGRAASGQSRVTPPVSPSPSQRLRRARPSPLPRDRASPRPRTPVRFHCPWKLWSSLLPLPRLPTSRLQPRAGSRPPAPHPLTLLSSGGRIGLPRGRVLCCCL